MSPGVFVFAVGYSLFRYFNMSIIKVMFCKHDIIVTIKQKRIAISSVEEGDYKAATKYAIVTSKF